MPQIKLYNEKGEAAGETALAAEIFDVKEVSPHLVHEIVVAMQANARSPIASTKDRGEVRGGGKKPWKQKGTGRARVGSIRSPLWIGGGVTFGPTGARNFARKINRKTKLKGLFGVLTDKVRAGKFFVLDSLDVSDRKTKTAARKLKDLSSKLPGLGKKILLIVPAADKNLIVAARNLPQVKMLKSNSVNILDILSADSLVILKEALAEFEKIYIKK